MAMQDIRKVTTRREPKPPKVHEESEGKFYFELREHWTH